MAELELKEVSYFYESGGKRIDILDKASYSFEKGTLYTIVGPSGSGKTTTLTLAGALEEPKSGCVCFEGKDIREIGYTRYRNSKIGIMVTSAGQQKKVIQALKLGAYEFCMKPLDKDELLKVFKELNA